MNANNNSVERFIVDPPRPELDTKKILKILQEIKELKDAFPYVKISQRSDFLEILVTNIMESTDHSIQLKFEKSWKVIDHQLPIDSILEKKLSTNLQDAVRTYIMLIENLEPFYTALEVLDAVCIVGEPVVITTKTNWRLVKYSNKVFIKIEFLNPLNLQEVSITFHGNTTAVKEMLEIYNLRSDDYDDDNIYQKLLSIFEVPYFPATEEDRIDCSICLCYRCDNAGCPIICCDNEKCDSVFHMSCLETYLKNRDHVKILSVCIGECPFCKHTLSNSYAPFFKRVMSEGSSSQEA